MAGIKILLACTKDLRSFLAGLKKNGSSLMIKIIFSARYALKYLPTSNYYSSMSRYPMIPATDVDRSNINHMNP